MLGGVLAIGLLWTGRRDRVWRRRVRLSGLVAVGEVVDEQAGGRGRGVFSCCLVGSWGFSLGCTYVQRGLRN